MADQEQPKTDFFTDLMFGRPAPPAESLERKEEEENKGAEPEKEDEKGPEQPPTETQPPNQMESIFALVQSLAPLMGYVQGLFSQQKKEDFSSTSKKENAND